MPQRSYMAAGSLRTQHPAASSTADGDAALCVALGAVDLGLLAVGLDATDARGDARPDPAAGARPQGSTLERRG